MSFFLFFKQTRTLNQFATQFFIDFGYLVISQRNSLEVFLLGMTVVVFEYINMNVPLRFSFRPDSCSSYFIGKKIKAFLNWTNKDCSLLVNYFSELVRLKGDS